VDWLTFGFTVLLLTLVVPIFAVLVWFVIKYRQGSTADRSHRVSGSMRIEAAWSIIPFVLALVFFVWAANLYYRLYHAPEGAIPISIVAKQWMWKAQHPGGQREINELHVPAGEPVKLTMISQDVIHSLFLPALRIKQDVLPDRYTSLWFNAERPGQYLLECAEFCGTQHSLMGGRLIVMTPADYQRWLGESRTDVTLAATGERLFRSYGCSGCHGANSAVRAPSLAGLFGRPVPLAGGTTTIADARYIRDSILQPRRDVVAGYEPIMPSFAGRIPEEDLLALVAYIQSLTDDEEKSR
jgi:cytochrome c oxidase subunit 2